MSRLLVSALLFAFCGLGPAVFAQGGADASDAQPRRFGPYEALTFNERILRDVKVTEDGNVYLQLLPEYKEKELIVKISNEYFAGYRKWWHGEYDLVSPANQGKTPYGWTDHVNTAGNYIEYWMDGDVFLHLKRVD
ncbi:hypothetical protein [Pelagicoccus sp. SDUM812003]|uniref:hypothetical protein n=1 Tax=Pelagicoccus sp. SDUM812003 TaxID=3041267 RepID=UPI00280DE85F|nr:hypothetical protein [Pelagicoccus sp. SDUM812003]MDQ8205343.1 hypothetical protein [Pelagicoccus sp. SDUM812003]